MYTELPSFGLRTYAWFFSRFGTSQPFSQSDLDFVFSEPMKKKTFALLLRAGWIRKRGRRSYLCNRPEEIFSHLLDFRVHSLMAEAKRPYSFTGLSAVEVWSDYSYVQRSAVRSPYFVRVLGRDLPYWKGFFALRRMPVFVGSGTTVGEFVILLPCKSLRRVQKDGLWVDSLQDTVRQASQNEMHSYACEYMRKKYGSTTSA